MKLQDAKLAWLPPEIPRSVDWIPANVRTPAGSEFDGFLDYDLAPHTRGVYEAFDDPNIREIYLCWATRNMKTTTLISLAIFAAVHCPRPMAFGSCDEMSIDRTIDEQIFPMLERCEATRRQLPPVAKRSRDCVRLDRCRIRKAFGGSKASVAGYPACYVFLNEVDKWPQRKSSEADTVRGFRQRAKGYPFESKILAESTPGEMETSRIWSVVTSPNADVRRFYVPCPHCREYQTLVFEQIKWEKNHGKSEVLLAERTAWYECLHCRKKIQNEDRPAMMRSGKWLSDGQTIDQAGKIHGSPKVVSPIVAFAYLGTEYSLLISGWGQQAAAFLECGHDPEKLRDFTNSNRALPWDPKPTKVEPNQIADTLGSAADTRGRAPEWAVFLTQGVDVQEGGELFKWQTVAWGLFGRCAVVDWGYCVGVDAIEAHLTRSLTPHADGGPPLRPLYSLVDSGDGNVTEAVYSLCRRLAANGVRAIPCKGSSREFPEAFRLSKLDDDSGNRRRKIFAGGVALCLVNSERSQQWLERHLNGSTKEHPDRLTIPAEAMLDFDLLDELANECKTHGRWIKRGPNDFRDCLRYAWAAANIVTNHGKFWDRLPERKPVSVAGESSPARERKQNPFTTGGGREWRNV